MSCTQTWLLWTAAAAWGSTCLRQTLQVCEKASAGILPDTTSHRGSSATCRPCCHSAHTCRKPAEDRSLASTQQDWLCYVELQIHTDGQWHLEHPATFGSTPHTHSDAAPTSTARPMAWYWRMSEQPADKQTIAPRWLQQRTMWTQCAPSVVRLKAPSRTGHAMHTASRDPPGGLACGALHRSQQGQCWKARSLRQQDDMGGGRCGAARLMSPAEPVEFCEPSARRGR